MDRNAFDQLFTQRKLPSVLLFDGEEEYLKRAALEKLRGDLLPAGLEELNESILDDPETDALIAAAETLPIMADRRLVLVRDHPALVGRAEADPALVDYLPRVPESTLLLFYCSRKPDARKRLYASVKKLDGVVTFSPLRNQELTSFVTGLFHQLGKECDDRTADYLIFTSGSDTTLLSQEIRKIASHDPSSPAVSPEEVRLLATPSLESTVFQMVDAVVGNQQSRAFSLMRSQLQNGEDRLFMLSMLLRQFRLMQHIKIMQYEKRGWEEIRAALGVPPFAADQYMRQAAAYTGGQVKEAVRLCFDTEYAVKSGRLNAEGSLESVLLKLLQLRS